MLGYESFHKHMENIRRQYRNIEDFVNQVGDQCPDGWETIPNSLGVDGYVELMEEIMGDKYNWISHHVFECECDYNNPYSVYFDSNLDEQPIDCDGDLYKLLTGEVPNTGLKAIYKPLYSSPELTELAAELMEIKRKRLLNKQLQVKGIAEAKKRGAYKGRQPIKVNERKFKDAYEKWRSGKITAKEAMSILKLKQSTFYRRIKEYEGK